jgi:heavy metal sensor kinase
MKHPRSIRFKLITFYVCVLSLVFLAFGSYIYVVFHQMLVRSLEKTLSRRAQQIATTIVDEMPARGELYVASEIQARYAPELNERVIRITDDQQHPIYTSQNASFLTDSTSQVSSALSKQKAIFWETSSRNGERYRLVAIGHQLSNGKTYAVEVGAPELEIDNALYDLVVTLLIGFPVLIGIAIFGGYSLLGRVLRPVDEIVGAAEQITFRERNKRLPVPATGDEFERISEALNRMIERLDESFQIANRFAGDASHELRTPLTVLQGELEAFINDPSFTGEAMERAGNMLEEVVRLSRIVEGLLLVSRLEAGEAQMKRARVNLGQIAVSVADQMQLLCEEKALQLRYEVAERVFVEGDEIRLRQIVVNLLDNAIKYTPEGGEIHLRVGALNNLAFIEIVDTGMGISAGALSQVFERFFRAEEARASRMQGTGLGLSIVKSIADAHGGKVQVKSIERGGTTVRVEFTLAKDEIGQTCGGVHLVA